MLCHYATVLCIALCSSYVLAGSYIHCRDVTEVAMPGILNVVYDEKFKLVYNESLSGLAKQYGTTGKEPEPKHDYISFMNTGTFPTRTYDLVLATEKVFEGISEEKKTELRNLKSESNFACLVTRCFKDADYAFYDLKVACVVKKAGKKG